MIHDFFQKKFSEKSFLCFVLMNRHVSKSQLYQDLWVLWQTRQKRVGYFVEFGATNGKDLSNTYLLEKKFQWRGILVEPFPYWHSQLRENRCNSVINHRCVWKNTGKKLQFLAVNETPELSGLVEFAYDDLHAKIRKAAKRIIEVETISLFDLLQQHGAPRQIEYLSIDTEGSEFEILKSFDFSYYTIYFMTVEHNYNEKRREEIHALLKLNGFIRVFEKWSKFDDWYINHSVHFK